MEKPDGSARKEPKITSIPGIGPKDAVLLKGIGIETLEDFLFLTLTKDGLARAANETKIPESRLETWVKQAALLARHNSSIEQMVPTPAFVGWNGFTTGTEESVDTVNLLIRCPLCSGRHSYRASIVRVPVMFSLGTLSALPRILVTLALSLAAAFAFNGPILRRIILFFAALIITSTLEFFLPLYRRKRGVQCSRIFLCPVKNELFQAKVTLPVKPFGAVKDVRIDNSKVSA